MEFGRFQFQPPVAPVWTDVWHLAAALICFVNIINLIINKTEETEYRKMIGTHNARIVDSVWAN